MPRYTTYPDAECYEKQAIASLGAGVAPPVQNTWYPIKLLDGLGADLDIKAPIRVIYFSMKHDNTDSSALTINMRVTIDGNVYTAVADAAGADNTVYYFYVDPTADALLSTTTVFNTAYYEALVGNSLKVEVRMTGVPGTAEKLYGWCQFEIMRRG